MNRKEFISSCTYACLGALGMAAFMQSCAPAKYLQVKPADNKLQIARNEFLKQGSSKHRRYVILKADELSYPIIVYRLAENDYSALLLRCTHQGAELSVNGDLLSCAAHGSEFGTRGEVVQGPADQSLKKFPVTTDSDNIYIQLT